MADSESLARYYAPLTPKDELEKVRRQVWPGAVILFVANATITYDVWRLHTNVVEANKVWERISVFLYGHLGFWPALLCGPLLGVVLSLAIFFRIRRLKEKANVNSA